MTIYDHFEDVCIFCELIEGETITQIARTHNLTRQAISARLRKSEEQLNIKFFYRDNNHLIPTDVALQIYPDAKVCRERLSNIISIIHAQEDKNNLASA